MTEYWQSKSRHYCSVCNCWLDSNPRSIRAHEEGKQHKESAERHRKKQRDQKDKETAEHDALQRQLDQVEKAAQDKYLKHDTGSGSNEDVISSSTSRSKPVKRSRNDTPLMPATPWQTALDRTTNMPYYFHPTTQQTTWNINDTFIVVQQPDTQLFDAANHLQQHDSSIPSTAAEQEHEEEHEEELDEMGLPKFKPVANNNSVTTNTLSSNTVSSNSHHTDQSLSSSAAVPSRSIDTAALAALPAGLFKKRKKT